MKTLALVLFTASLAACSTGTTPEVVVSDSIVHVVDSTVAKIDSSKVDSVSVKTVLDSLKKSVSR